MKTMKSWLAVAAIGFGALTMMGCAAETAASEPSSDVREHLASTSENLTVDGVVLVDGTVKVDARRPDGQPVLSLVVKGETLSVDLFESYRRGSATMTVPEGRAAAQTLADWNGFAKYMSESVTTPHGSEAGGIKVQMSGTCPWTDLWCQPGGAYWAMAEWWNSL